MSDEALQEAKLAEYHQLRIVERLRQQFYAQPDPSASVELAEMLAQAEEELHRLEEGRRGKEQAEGRGVLLTVSDERERTGGIKLGPATTGVDAQVLLRQSHVPTGIVHLLDAERTPLVTFHVKYVGDKYVRLRLTSIVEGYSAHAMDTVELFPDESAEKSQLPTFFPDRLHAVTELTRVTLHIRIDDLDRKTELERTFPIWLLARTSAYIGVEDPSTGGWLDLSPYFAAWVTPNAPAVMELLRRAADLHPDRQIAGYQVGPEGVAEQVKAIFNVLKAEEIVYVNSVLSFGATKGEYMQRVRLPRESLESKSANCIDGTVLMASVLEAASLNPGLVIVPGHAFLAWETQRGNGQWDYLETTMISAHDFEVANKAGKAQAKRQRALAERLKDSRYFQLHALADLRTNRGITPME